MSDVREIEERRFAAVTALRAMVECLRETNPQVIFPAAKEGSLDPTKVQAISNRWADKASDVLLQALGLADRIGLDALDMFTGSDSEVTAGHGAERVATP